jgi:hypothetical protein
MCLTKVIKILDVEKFFSFFLTVGMNHDLILRIYGQVGRIHKVMGKQAKTVCIER